MGRKLEVRKVPETGKWLVVLHQDDNRYSSDKVESVAMNAIIRKGGMRPQIFNDGRARIEGVDGDLVRE